MCAVYVYIHICMYIYMSLCMYVYVCVYVRYIKFDAYVTVIDENGACSRRIAAATLIANKLLQAIIPS